MTLPSSDLPPVRRGPHPLVALAAFTALVLAATVVMLALTSLGRLLDWLV